MAHNIFLQEYFKMVANNYIKYFSGTNRMEHFENITKPDRNFPPTCVDNSVLSDVNFEK